MVWYIWPLGQILENLSRLISEKPDNVASKRIRGKSLTGTALGSFKVPTDLRFRARYALAKLRCPGYVPTKRRYTTGKLL